MSSKAIFLASVCLLWACSHALAGPVGDYGDAPDVPNGLFPSWAASNGPRHLDVSREWIGGGAVSTTTVENDSNQVDADVDNGQSWWVRANNTNWFITKVSYDPLLSQGNEMRYLNVLGDANGNGQWDVNEWAVKNHGFTFPNQPNASSLYVAMTVGQGFLPANMVNNYTRVTLSTAPAPAGVFSGAWGAFDRGETEDFKGELQPDGSVGPAGVGPAPINAPGKLLPTLGSTNTPANMICDVCATPCIATPLCPDHAYVHGYRLYTPVGTVAVGGMYWDTDMCTNAHCGGSRLDSWVAGVQNPAIPIGAAPPPPPGAPPYTWMTDWVAGGVTTYWAWDGLTAPTGHTTNGAQFIVVYDPQEEWWQATMSLEYDTPQGAPEPASAAILLLGTALLGRRRTRP